MTDISTITEKAAQKMEIEYSWSREAGKYILEYVLDNGRNQMVYVSKGISKGGKRRNEDLVLVETNVGTYNQYVDPVFLLESNSSLIFSKVVLRKDTNEIEDIDDDEMLIDMGYREIMVESSFFLSDVTEEILVLMIEETAICGDELEYILFGVDVE